MSYALLWIETTALALIWMAAMLAVAAHFRSRLWYALAVVGIVLVPLVPIAGVAIELVLARLATGIRHSALAYFVSQAVVLILGICIILRLAMRASPTPRGRAAAGWPRARLLLTWLMTFALWIMTAWNIELATRTQLLALRQEAGALLLSVAPPVTNDAQNAALLYEKASRRLDADTEIDWKAEENILDRNNPDPADPTVAPFLARHAPTLLLIRQATELPECYFNQNLSHPDMQLLLDQGGNKLKVAILLLQLHRRYETAQGHLDSAIDDTNAMFRLADHAGRTPLLVTSLVAVGLDHLAVKNVEELLPALTTVQQVARLKLDDPDRLARMMRRALTGEEAFGIASYCDVIGGLEGSPLAGRTSADTPGAFVRLQLMGNDLDGYREIMATFRSLLGKPFYAIQPELRQFNQKFEHPKGFMTLVMPAVQPVLPRCTQLTAELQCARLAVAATQYRIARGELPTTLQNLMPDYLTELPLDPFDGKPLRMKRLADKLVFYSVGPDLKDDGGMEFDKKTQLGDITFTLKVKQRASR